MAKTNKHGLGRGLDALLSSTDPMEIEAQEKRGDEVRNIRITLIDPNRDQPRKRFSEASLKELSDSIRAVGVIQPIIVSERNGRYMIIAGERRFRASRLAGLHEIPAIIRDFDEVKRLEVALIENLQRDDLNPVEQAEGIRRLMDQHGYTQEAVAERLGASRSSIANILRLLTLDPAVLEMLVDGRLSAGHGRALAAVKDAAVQRKLAELAVAHGYSVRQLERICANPPEEKEERQQKAKRDPELNELERMARDVFGTRAQIDGDGEKGKLVLHYFGADDLQRIWEVLEFIRQGS